MSKSIVKKALEMIDDDDKPTKLTSIKKKKAKKDLRSQPTPSVLQDRRELARKCAALKKISRPVVSSEQIEQLNNYRFHGPSNRNVQQQKKKKEKDENPFTEEDFQRFAREYNPPISKS